MLLTGKQKRNEWPMGVIVETKVSQDGLVRRVKVRLGARSGRAPVILERSVRDLVLLAPSIDHVSPRAL